MQTSRYIVNYFIINFAKNYGRTRDMRSQKQSEIQGSLSFKLISLNRNWCYELGSVWL